MKKIIVFVLLGFLSFSCKNDNTKIALPSPKAIKYSNDTLTLDKAVYYDKVLGSLVGSAIGDAMGASTEMWHRKDIQLKYGYITGLTPAVREQSPEGTWAHNLMAGATTDDTRWKYLMVHYLKNHPENRTPSNFATFITSYYQQLTKDLAQENIQKSTDSLDSQIEKIDWIKEWARVALAYEEGKDAYMEAQNRFYGGEMSCAGQLYTPMFGLVAKNPSEAYEMAYDHSLFDIGYAKDISSLVAAMTNMALRTQDMDSILYTTAFVDPKGYQDSRLVGRIPYKILDGAQKSISGIRALVLVDSLIIKDSILFKTPKGFKGTKKDWVRQEMVYQLLEKDERSIAFHSGEIWQILVTGMEFGEGDFLKTMQFIVNYGRDNDTVAAVAGMILGAKDGFENLPQDLREEVLRVNRENFGIDLEVLAQELTDVY